LKGKIFQVVLVLVLLFVTGFTGCIKAQKEALPSKPSIPPEFFLDSDGDGFNDWFEINVSRTDPNAPNDRYIILYSAWKKTDNMEGITEGEKNFWLTKAKVTAENVIMLTQEKATDYNLRAVIKEVAAKTNENDIVFISLHGHGGKDRITTYYYQGEDPNWPSNPGAILYTDIDEWLNEINAKVVIIQMMACDCEKALPVLKDGSCPRIVFVHTAREFIEGLGEYPDYAIAADTKYGNGDGYVSVGEVASWIDNDPMWGPDWGIYETMEERYEKGRSHLEAEGYSKMSDTSNIADRTYLTDYTYCKVPPLLRKP